MLNSHFEESAATISYQLPEDISINLGQRYAVINYIRVDTLPGFPVIKEATISQKTYFQLVSEEEEEERELRGIHLCCS